MSGERFLCVKCGRGVRQDGDRWVHDDDHTPVCPPPSDR